MSIFDQLAQDTFVVCDQWLSEHAVLCLRQEIEALRAKGAFHKAGVGQSATRQDQIRGDEILWLDPALGPWAGDLIKKIDEMRLALNRELLLNLTDFEAHFAVYPRGTFYKKHLDQTRRAPGSWNSTERAMTMLIYLNPDWSPQDEGNLVIYDPTTDLPLHQIEPLGGRMLLFRSDLLLHEVLAPCRDRWSLTCWFRRR